MNREEARLNEEREAEELQETEDAEQEYLHVKKKAKALDGADEAAGDRLREAAIGQDKEEKEKAVWKEKFEHQSYDITDELDLLRARIQERTAEHKKTKEALLTEFDYAH